MIMALLQKIEKCFIFESFLHSGGEISLEAVLSKLFHFVMCSLSSVCSKVAFINGYGSSHSEQNIDFLDLLERILRLGNQIFQLKLSFQKTYYMQRNFGHCGDFFRLICFHLHFL